FSSRRRHTRFSRDWSSDVCSSDLPDEVSAIPGVDVVVGSHRRAELVDMVEEVFRTRRPVRAVEKIFKVREFEELPALDFEGRTRSEERRVGKERGGRCEEVQCERR